MSLLRRWEAGETIAFRQVADVVWTLLFDTVERGRLDERDEQFKT